MAQCPIQEYDDLDGFVAFADDAVALKMADLVAGEHLLGAIFDLLGPLHPVHRPAAFLAGRIVAKVLQQMGLANPAGIPVDGRCTDRLTQIRHRGLYLLRRVLPDEHGFNRLPDRRSMGGVVGGTLGPLLTTMGKGPCCRVFAVTCTALTLTLNGANAFANRLGNGLIVQSQSQVVFNLVTCLFGEGWHGEYPFV